MLGSGWLAGVHGEKLHTCMHDGTGPLFFFIRCSIVSFPHELASAACCFRLNVFRVFRVFRCSACVRVKGPMDHEKRDGVGWEEKEAMDRELALRKQVWKASTFNRHTSVWRFDRQFI